MDPLLRLSYESLITAALTIFTLALVLGVNAFWEDIRMGCEMVGVC
jgi:hypothetical protein